MAIASSSYKLAFVWTALCIQLVWSQSRQNHYASILQDSRNEPTPDGYFGYLYKTEDGIVSSARGEPNGVIHGTFSYTDPTGLRVNYNYNAGNRFTPGLNYHKGRLPAAAPGAGRAAASSLKARYQDPDYEDDGQYREQPEDDYVEPLHSIDPELVPVIENQMFIKKGVAGFLQEEMNFMMITEHKHCYTYLL